MKKSEWCAVLPVFFIIHDIIYTMESTCAAVTLYIIQIAKQAHIDDISKKNHVLEIAYFVLYFYSLLFEYFFSHKSKQLL